MTFKNSMTISVVNVIDTIMTNESLKSMTARNIMMAAYISTIEVKSSNILIYQTYLVNGFPNPYQECFEI